MVHSPPPNDKKKEAKRKAEAEAVAQKAAAAAAGGSNSGANATALANSPMLAAANVPRTLAAIMEADLASPFAYHRAPSDVEETAETRRLVAFVSANATLLNAMVAQNMSLLETSLSVLVSHPPCCSLLSFDNKRTYFRSAMRKLRHRRQGSLRVAVRRDRVFEDSYNTLRLRSAEEMRQRINVTFQGEDGVDAGGLTREWYLILSREIFNANYALFIAAADSPTYQPNAMSKVNTDHLEYFKFVGRVIGKAIADGQLLDAFFTRSFYKHMLGIPVNFTDLEAIDPEYYKNLRMTMETPLDMLGLELDFSAQRDEFGKMSIVDLVPDGRNVPVTDENKSTYCQLMAKFRMTDSIKEQIGAFLAGFHELVPPDLVALFSEKELELLISGTPEIDLDDLYRNTDYHHYRAGDQMIRWFWAALRSFSKEEKALFLQFVTGTTKVPLEGFQALQGMRGETHFQIHKAYGGPVALPTSHTCFNQLDLPEYGSQEETRQKLLLACKEGSEGFGFA